MIAKPRGMFPVVSFLLFSILTPLILVVFAMPKQRLEENKYIQEGIYVVCEVNSTLTLDGKQTVTGIYHDAKGTEICAGIIANQRTKAGARLFGYVLPDQPDVVYCPAPRWKKIMFSAVMLLFFLSGAYFLLSFFYEYAVYLLLIKRGNRAEATLTRVWPTGRGMHGNFRFLGKSGRIYERELDLSAGMFGVSVGERFGLLYYEVPYNRCIARLCLSEEKSK